MAYNNRLKTNNPVEVKLNGNLDVSGFVGLLDEVRDGYKKSSLSNFTFRYRTVLGCQNKRERRELR